MNRRAKRSNGGKSLEDKIILYSGIGVVALAVIVIGLLIYSKTASDNSQSNTRDLTEIGSLNSNSNSTENINNTESASTEIGKSVNEAKNENNQNNNKKTTNTNTNNTAKSEKNITEKKLNTTTDTSAEKQQTEQENEAETSNNETNNRELNFEKPVEGQIIKEYAKDNLVYSETLKEWTTHLGIDIKADKTTVVKAAEAGTVKSIKNDPRYGLTVVIEHDEHYQSLYANLLTTEFVVEGEKVEKGQSIGTIGNTATFEIADEPHLHFEILKDNIQEEPRVYLNY